jgi:anti-sigma B factor antagonist
MGDHEDITVEHSTHGDAAILKPIGEIDLSRAPGLRMHLMDVLSAKPPVLIIDLAEVPYMDSSGVATCVEAMQVSRRSGTRLFLSGLQERVRSIFEIARLDEVFTIVDSPSAALNAS